MLATTRCTLPQVPLTRCPAARPFAVLLLVGLFAAVFAQSLQAVAADPPIAKDQVPALLKHSLTRIDGQPLPLAKYRGKLLLVVNVASRCGYTSQYAALQKLHERFAARGLIVLGVPSNDFGDQEPLSNDEIAAFCKKNYGVTFTLAAKTKVRGKDKHKFFAHLVAKETSPKLPGEIKWNFEKFLIDRDGLLVARYGSPVDPLSPRLVAAIATRLGSDQTDYVRPMKKVAARFAGRRGVVLHVGDSITYANPYGQWARGGMGQTADDKKILAWMHAGEKNDRDGWHLAAVNVPGGRSQTACSGIRADEMLKGGRANMPPLAEILNKYRPQIVVYMLGTNDASANRPVKEYIVDVHRAVEMMSRRGIICILSTIPPHVHQRERAADYNDALRRLAVKKGLPLIDLEQEILMRRPFDWSGTLLAGGDVHPSATYAGTQPNAEPTPANLRNSGYLLRGWLSLQKIKQVKRRVIEKGDKSNSRLLCSIH